MKKKYLIIGILVLLGIALLFFFKKDGDAHELATVTKKELVKEVFESGAVKTGEDLTLSFQTGGVLGSLNVEEGEKVEKGQFLASLDSTDLLLQKIQAESKLKSAKANLEITVKGARPEEIESLVARLKETEDVLELAEESLEQAKQGRKTALESAYSGIPSLVNQSYLLSKELKDTYKSLRDKYFSGFYLQDTYMARDKVKEIEDSYEKLRNLSRNLTVNSSYEDIDKSLVQAQEIFQTIEKAIETMIDISDTDFYDRRFSITDDKTLWSTKRNVSDMLSNITAAISELESTKNSTKSAVTSAESSLNTTKSKRNELKDQLELAQQSGRIEQIRTALANLQAAQAGFALAKNNLQKATLHSPVKGVVRSINYKESESVTLNSPVIVITPENKFYVKLNIYEGDIAKVSTGDKANISFIAFDENVEGEVISKSKTGQLIDGVIYFETKVAIDNPPEGLLNEMTGDVSIVVESKKALALPREAVKTEDGQNFVKVLQDGKLVDKKIEIGIIDSYGYAEIISGLERGDEVVMD